MCTLTKKKWQVVSVVVVELSIVVSIFTKKVAKSISSKGFCSSVYFDEKSGKKYQLVLLEVSMYSSVYFDEKSGKKYLQFSVTVFKLTKKVASTTYQ